MSDLFADAAPDTVKIDIAGRSIAARVERRAGRIVGVSTDTADAARAAAVRAVNAGLEQGRTLDEVFLRLHACHDLAATLLQLEAGR